MPDCLLDLADLAVRDVDLVLSPLDTMEVVIIGAVLGAASGAPALGFATAHHLRLNTSWIGVNGLFDCRFSVSGHFSGICYIGVLQLAGRH